MKQLILLVTVLSFFTGGSLFAQETDITDDMINHITRHFINSSASASKTWDHTDCRTREPITGKCIGKVGHKTYGKARISVKYVIDSSGEALHLLLPAYDINIVKTDLIMNFKYEGQSSGKKQCWPGNFHCGWDWESLHPAGRIEIKLRADSGTSFGMWVHYTVEPGHDDKANNLAKDAAKSLKPKMRDIVEQFLRNKGIPVEVTLKN